MNEIIKQKLDNLPYLKESLNITYKSAPRKLFEENTMYKDLQLPSDFLIDNHKSLQQRNDFEDLCESLDELQHEAMNIAFQDGFNQGELNILRQFVEGNLDRDYVLEMFGDQLGDMK